MQAWPASIDLVNSIASAFVGKLAAGPLRQSGLMVVAVICHFIFYGIFIFWRVPALQCATDVCGLGGNSQCYNQSESGGTLCSAFDSYDGLSCAPPSRQCDLFDGTAVPPTTDTLLLLFGGNILFALGDAVLESLLPALLQTMFQGEPHH